MNREELMEKFEKYDFRDPHGHPLVNCLEFQMLIDDAVSSARQVRNLERALCERPKHERSNEN